MSSAAKVARAASSISSSAACLLTAIAGERSAIKLKGCGLLVINPPWQFEREAGAMLALLAEALAQAPGGGGRVDWIVRE